MKINSLNSSNPLCDAYVLEKISSFLEPNDYLNARHVCRVWNEVILYVLKLSSEPWKPVFLKKTVSHLFKETITKLIQIHPKATSQEVKFSSPRKILDLFKTYCKGELPLSNQLLPSTTVRATHFFQNHLQVLTLSAQEKKSVHHCFFLDRSTSLPSHSIELPNRGDAMVQGERYGVVACCSKVNHLYILDKQEKLSSKRVVCIKPEGRDQSAIQSLALFERADRIDLFFTTRFENCRLLSWSYGEACPIIPVEKKEPEGSFQKVVAVGKYLLVLWKESEEPYNQKIFLLDEGVNEPFLFFPFKPAREIVNLYGLDSYFLGVEMRKKHFDFDGEGEKPFTLLTVPKGESLLSIALDSPVASVTCAFPLFALATKKGEIILWNALFRSQPPMQFHLPQEPTSEPRLSFNEKQELLIEVDQDFMILTQRR